MRTLIVDDEPLARLRLKRLLNEYPYIEYVGEAETAQDALSKVEELQPDLVMLDIEMPGGDGLSLAETLSQRQIPPAIILVTAHPEHALDAYRVGPSDYLLKPVDPKRLKDAMARLGTHTRAHIEKNEELNPWISYQVGNSLRRIRLDEVQYFMAEDKVVKMVFDGGEAIVDFSLAKLEQHYQFALIRISRSTLVNRSSIQAIVRDEQGFLVKLIGSNHSLPISRRLTKQVKSSIKDDYQH